MGMRAPHAEQDEQDAMNIKRMRGRNHRGNGGGGGGFRQQQPSGIPLNRNHVFDSNGPEMRLRGTAQQLFDKYQQLARDASGGGDRVTAEAYYQHAEHYFRIIAAMNQAQGQPNGQPQPNGQGGQPNVPEHQGRQNGHRRQHYAEASESGAAESESHETRVDIGPELDAALSGATEDNGEQADSREIPILTAPPEA
jgi:Domain of unknown function (DUF4167)